MTIAQEFAKGSREGFANGVKTMRMGTFLLLVLSWHFMLLVGALHIFQSMGVHDFDNLVSPASLRHSLIFSLYFIATDGVLWALFVAIDTYLSRKAKQ